MNARLLLTALVTLFASTAHADSEFRRQGFYLGLGTTARSMTLDFQTPIELDDEVITIDESGQGGRLLGGYRYRQGFAIQLGLVGSNHQTSHADTDVLAGLAQLDAITWLAVDQRVQPFLAAGFGVSSLAFRGPGDEDRGRLTGGQVDVGGGVDVQVFSKVDFGVVYRYSLQRFQEAERIHQVRDDQGSGEAHSWGAQLRWYF